MSYQLKDIAHLHGRDFIFAVRYWQNKLMSQLRRNPHKSLILCNSYPKSGTHLLYQILYSIPDLQKWDDIVSVQALCGVMNTADHVRWKLGSAPNHSIVRSHLMYCDEILNILRNLNCKTLFIYRDLRDIAVSHARWVTKEKRIFLHDFYISEDTFDQQLMYSIKGVPVGSPFGSNVSQPDIGSDFRRWNGWVTDSATLSIKFEDLVGERGGGSEDTRLLRVEQIFDHLSISIPIQQVKEKFASYVLSPNESHTFRKGGKGSIGGWKTHFKEDHKTEFKKVAGELLIRLGYEEDYNW